MLTHESTETLGLNDGAAASPLISVVGHAGVEEVARRSNCPRATSCAARDSVKRGAVNAEVSLMLDGGIVITAVVTDESADTLGLADGTAAIAAFKASSVILGVND